ncbi:hypothetical protein JCGZ_23330 [Jatropha curcas]|uniref:C2H2-type domain-containing protein n=1 Tax=Jatropha curcas TaxID=180498 RepID=A0A067JHZ3_JATCU|nr:zinc finger protein GAI-ASSOCIATED FACTOR 1 [Jatropha curcas]KDP23497.1 hypothetical protein JCGZ_23330 [Jatropha curcas]
MSNITGEGGSFSSGNNNTAGVGEVEVPHFNSIASSTTTTITTTNSNGSAAQQPVKKKRNLPGNPDPSAEVIALSPNTLLATNRFVCEICNKGFQRDQNLQLHRRGHNLPWKLKQRTSTEIRKRVYVCPEPSCVHHNPARALGDLTGIKKHFCRKHGEKKWKCDKCSKKYAVQSDWKAHSKTCGTKEYKCDCGTIFSRRDSFITHRAFCDALTEEKNKANQGILIPNSNINNNTIGPNLISMPINSNEDQSTLLSPNFNHIDPKIPLSLPHELTPLPPKPSSATLFGGARNLIMANNTSPSSLQLNANSSSTSFEGNGNLLAAGFASMSATALLQKAAQMGVTTASTNLNSPTMNTHKSFVTSTSMAPSTFDDDDRVTRGNDGGYLMVANDLGMFNGVLEQNSALFKNIQQENSNNKNNNSHIRSGLSRFSGDVMTTVDFLGVGGSRQRSIFQEHQKQEMDQFRGMAHQRMQGLGHFEQQASALEKPMWDI